MKFYLSALWVSAALFSTGCIFQGEDDDSGGSTDAGDGDDSSTGGELGTGPMMSGGGTDPAGSGSGGLDGAGAGSNDPSGTDTGGAEASGGSDTGGDTGGTDPGGTDTGGTDTGGTDTGGTGAGGSGLGGGDDRCRVYLDGDIPVCCTPQGTNRTNVDEVVELLNAYRISLGLNALASDPILEETIHAHCIHMEEADFFSHTSPVQMLSSPWDRVKLCGGTADGENIARGQSSPANVMQSWKNSSGHDDNMRGNHTLVGVGEYERNWGQIFK